MNGSIVLTLALAAAGGLSSDGGPSTNVWRELPESGVDPRPGRALTYVPGLRQFWLTAGQIEKPDWQVQVLDLAKGRWETVLFDKAKSGQVPDLRYTHQLDAYYQHAYDPVTKKIVHYIENRVFLYDPVKRVYETPAAKTGPRPQAPFSPGAPLWLWGALCYDPQNSEVLLFGGANALTERGDPGVWTYRVPGNTWTALDVSETPPQRALSPMVYDPKTKSIVLFGGDQLDRLLADTWVYDCQSRTWAEKRPPISPSPRAAHALLYLPKSGTIALIGGYTYTHTTDYMAAHHVPMPMEVWTYDVAENRWSLVKAFPKNEPVVPQGFRALAAAVNEEDVVVALARGRHWYGTTTGTWVCAIDATARDSAAEAKLGVPPGTVLLRKDPYTVEYFTKGVPPGEPAAVEAALKGLPANAWYPRRPPRRPAQNRDWGTAVLDPDRDQVYRWSGGHSAHSGTDVPIYSIKTDRWRLTYPPEFPIEFCYSNGGTPGQWSFRQRPWMTGHTYHAYAYDPVMKKVVISGKGAFTYIFDPDQGDFEPPAVTTPFAGGYYYTTLCSTPKGAVAWSIRSGGDSGLWRMNAEKRTWETLKATGRLPAQQTWGADAYWMVHDSKRDRLLLASGLDRAKGVVHAYDLATNEVKALNPAGTAATLKTAFLREAVYLPKDDAVLLLSRGAPEAWLYDCQADAWRSIVFQFVPKDLYGVSTGLMYDPNRDLVWAVDTNSNVYVLRVDKSAAKAVE